MTDNLPAVRSSAEPVPVLADVDSWTHVVSDVARLSEHIAGTEFVPKGLRDKPAAVAAAILYGREVGLPPMTSLTQTHVIEGKPAISAEGMRALILAAGHDLVTTETTGALCTMKGRRRGSDVWTAITWTIDMARAAGVASKQVWKSYPRAMLQARATAELARLVFPDVIHGFRAVEELDDSGDVVDVAPEGPSSSTGSTVARKGRTTIKKTAAAKPAPEKPAERPAIEGPPLPGEEGYDAPKTAGEVEDAPVKQAPEHRGEAVERPASPAPDEGSGDVTPVTAPEPSTTDGGDDAPTAPPSGPRKASRPQLRMMHATFGSLGFNDAELGGREARLTVVSEVVGRPVESSADLTVDEASAVIDTLARCKTREDVENVMAAIEEHRAGR